VASVYEFPWPKLKGLQTPLLTKLKELPRRGDALPKEPDSEDQSLRSSQHQELDRLTAQFKQTPSSVLPLSIQGFLLCCCERGLANWQSTIRSRYTAEWRRLWLRLALLGVVLVVIFAVAEFNQPN
jgi:hypothetical protein